MRGHVRANLWLLSASVLVCSVLYPLVLWGIGQTCFPERANGSIITDPETGRPAGSRLIGQPFTQDQYFQPRPSAAGSGNGYNAAASGASNFAASNPLLRAASRNNLGRSSDTEAHRPRATRCKKISRTGFGIGPPLTPKSRSASSPSGPRPIPVSPPPGSKPTDRTRSTSRHGRPLIPKWSPFSCRPIPIVPIHSPRTWLSISSRLMPGNTPAGFQLTRLPMISRRRSGRTSTPAQDIQSFFFDMWLQEHADARLEQVPADMVMASGSGLDPDITLKNALYQLDRVADAWAKSTQPSSSPNRSAKPPRRESPRTLNKC